MNERVFDENSPPPPVPFQAGFDTYQSVFTYRYGSPEMRRNWSRQTYLLYVRDVLIEVASVQYQAGVRGITRDAVKELRANRDNLSVERVDQWEYDPNFGTRQDALAGMREYSEVAPLGGAIAGRGLTSEDPYSNAEALQMRGGFSILRPKIVRVLGLFGDRILEHKDLVCNGITHLSPAEPTTMGLRFAKYGQNLLANLEAVDDLLPRIKGKGIKGPVGTRGSMENVLKGTSMTPKELEKVVMGRLRLDYFDITDQTYPRSMLFDIDTVLAKIALTLHHFGFDIQHLCSPFINEISESKGGATSFSMPHKRSPINSENIDALTELLPGHLISAWINGAFSQFERTLRDSAGKRSWLPESFLIVDEALSRAERVLKNMRVHENAVGANFRRHSPFFTTEIIMDNLASAGMDRKLAHDIMAEHTEVALGALREGKANPLKKLYEGDERITDLIGTKGVRRAFRDIYDHIGDATQMCVDFVENRLKPALN